MSKIRVNQLAQRMGIPNQDLMFKLKSIGVRVDDENAEVDPSVLQAILTGKKLPSPREVIIRDEESKATAPAAPVRRRPGARRMPPNPLRPGRRRTIIQKVEPRIKTIPVSERPQPVAPVEPPPPAPKVVAPASTSDAATDKRRAKPGSVRPDRKGKRSARPSVPQEEDLRAYRGAVQGIEAVEEAAAPVAEKAAGRRRRRTERKQREGTGTPGLTFDGDAPTEPITLSEGMTVRVFAEKLGVKAGDLIKELLRRGQLANVNHVLDTDVAAELATDLGVETMEVTFEEEVQLVQEADDSFDGEKSPRAPVVTIMGHVDHGKTTLLDAIRESRVTEGEFGGITQHIGAYEVHTNNQRIVFLDTPGHEAFTLMRARGAKATDIVILVVAADDGVMPQTLEAIDHARAANVPIIVAINKIDKDNANQDRVKKELSERGLMVEDWGGDTVSAAISALNKEGIPELLELIVLTAELLELKATPTRPAQGVVLEARKEIGRGIVATALIQDGTVRIGDVFVAGHSWGRVRSMANDLGERLETAGPATPVEITGFDDLPHAGDSFQAVENEAKARGIADFRQQARRQRELAPTPSKVSLEQLFERIQEGDVKELNVVLKGDVQGSVEVLKDTLAKLSTEKVKVQILRSGVGAISNHDVLLASASNAIVIGFNVRPERNASDLAEREEVDIRLHTVIYELADELVAAMTGLLEPTFREVAAGRAEVREVFSVPKSGGVAGSHVVEGRIPRNAQVRLLRDNVVVYEGTIASLRRFKDDVSEVRNGFDCGIKLDRYQDVKPGDIIEAFVQEEVAPTL